MPQSLTRNLVFFISGCFILTLLQPNLEYEFALYGVAIENGQWYRLLTVAPVMVANFIFGLIWIVIFYISGTNYPIPGIDWKAHLGGLVGGVLATVIVKRK